MDNFENTPDDNEQKQIEQVMREIQELKDQLERMQNRSPEMRGITLAMNDDVNS